MLTVVIFVLVWFRRRSKRELKRRSTSHYDLVDVSMVS